MDEFTLWNKYRINKRGILYNLKSNRPVKWRRGEYYKLLFSSNKGGECERILLHRAIAQKHLPNWSKDCIVHHLDGNPKNNHYANLYCCKNAEEHKAFHLKWTKRPPVDNRIVWTTPDGEMPGQFLQQWKISQSGENVIFS